MYVPSSLGLGQNQLSINVARAILRNRQYQRSLGWTAHRERIARELRLASRFDETAFALAVARWQERRGLAVDGIIGPDTWSLMRVTIGLVRPPALSLDVQRAVRLNRLYAQRLSWESRRAEIMALLGLPPSADQRAFAEAVARWQERQDLAVDGIIGPDTWSLMTAAMARMLTPSTPRPDSLRQVIRRALVLLDQSGRTEHRLFAAQIERLRCVLRLLLRNPRADSRYFPEAQFDFRPAHPTILRRLTPSEFNARLSRMSADLTGERFAPTQPDRRFLEELDGLDKQFFLSAAIVARHVHTQARAADPGMLQLQEWMLNRHRDPNSIYSCIPMR